MKNKVRVKEKKKRQFRGTRKKLVRAGPCLLDFLVLGRADGERRRLKSSTGPKRVPAIPQRTTRSKVESATWTHI